MELDDFIQGALVQIATGVYRANVELTGTNTPSGTIPFLMQRGNAAGESTGVAFDIAVTARTTAQEEAGGKFKIFVVDAGLEGKLSHEREQASRIRFTVGVDQRLGYALPGVSAPAA